MSSVYFSLVSPDKGADLVLGAADALPQVEFHFYGRIEEGYEERFSAAVARRENVSYHGVFDSVAGDVVSELSKYDLHLFPTLCPNEGVPGVIVETKMAAVPTVASGRGYNAELVEDGVDGVITHEDTVDEMARVIEQLAENPERVDGMKAAALGSAERYCIDRYLDMIVEELDARQ